MIRSVQTGCVTLWVVSGQEKNGRPTDEQSSKDTRFKAMVDLGQVVNIEEDADAESVAQHGIRLGPARTSVEVARLGNKSCGGMTYDAIAADVSDTHNQLIELYRYLASRVSA